jgi:hypothetical protein
MTLSRANGLEKIAPWKILGFEAKDFVSSWF